MSLHLTGCARAPDGDDIKVAADPLLALLLAELQDIVERFRRCCMASGVDASIADRGVAKARAAIARATGSPP